MVLDERLERLLDWHLADEQERLVEGLPSSWGEMAELLGESVAVLRGWLERPEAQDEMQRRLQAFRTSPDLAMRLEKALVRQAEEGDPVAAEKLLRHYERIRALPVVDVEGRGSASQIDSMGDEEFEEYFARLTASSNEGE